MITSVSVPRAVRAFRNFAVSAKADDPAGPNDKLDWNVNLSGAVRNSGDYKQNNTEKFAQTFAAANGRSTAKVGFVVTNSDGLQASANANVAVQRRRRSGDPLVFDLNNDNKVETVGAESVQQGVEIPPGIWSVQLNSVPAGQSQYTIANTNKGQGSFAGEVGSSQEINSSGRWQLGASTSQDPNKAGSWISQPLTAKVHSETQITVQGSNFSFTLTRTSDGGYKADDLGVTNVGGDKVLFDLDPNRSSWSLVSSTFRPGNGAPALPRGYAQYENGSKVNIGKDGIWFEDTGKGNRAKLYDATGEWVGEWVNGKNHNITMGIAKIRKEPSGSKVVQEMDSWFGTTTKMV